MVVHHISHYDPEAACHMIHVSTNFLCMQGTSKIDLKMVKFLPVSRAGNYGIETGPGHCFGYSHWELQRKKFNSPTPNMQRIHRRDQEAAPI